MALLPFPGAGDYLLYILILRLPLQLSLNLLRTCDQNSRVTGARRGFNGRDRMASYSAGHVDYLTHTKPCAVAEVVDELVSKRESLEGQKVSTRQILHMNVVANASTVRRSIIGAKDRDRWSFSGSNLKNQRNQVRLRIVSLAQRTSSARSIEVT